MNATGHVEIETKFDVDETSGTPDLTALRDSAGLVADAPAVHELSATYFDTEDAALQRRHVTFRRRTGGTDAGWHLKTPAPGGGRLERHAPLGADDEVVPDGQAVPDDLVRVVFGLVRGRELRPVARVDNERHVTVLRDRSGDARIEFCDDHVRAARLTVDGSAVDGSAQSWREWEVEIVDPDALGSAGQAEAVAAACRDAGAVPAASDSKLARTLGEPPAAPAPTSAVAKALHADLDQLLDHDAGARAGDMHGVHQARVAVRGLRSTLGSFAVELEAVPAAAELDLAEIASELKIFAAVLGKVRDIQVVRGRLVELYENYPVELVDDRVRGRIALELDSHEKRAAARVAAAMTSERYTRLLDDLHALAEAADHIGAQPSEKQPSQKKPSEKKSAGGKSADRSGDAEVVLRGVDRQFAKFTKARTRTERDLDSLDLSLAQREELTHVVRKRAKALRRGVNSLPRSGPLTVSPLRTACQNLHTVLGEVQDSVTTREWLRRIAARAEASGEPTFGFGILFEHERGFSERALAGFESDAATVTAAYRELSESRRAARKRSAKAKKSKKAK